MNSEVEEIKNRLNIVDIIGEYIRLDKAGSNWKANCPFHNEKSPSFMVSEDKQIWHCFGCQKGGDIFGFLMDIEGIDFREALKTLAEKAGVELKKIDPRRKEEQNRQGEILEIATKFFQAHLLQTKEGGKIIRYLEERGINKQSIIDFRLGYAPEGWNNISQFLQKKGYALKEIVQTGLLVEKNNQAGGQNSSYYDRFRDRIMFPIADTNGKVVGYSARVAPGGDESQAKYINTPETEIYHKSRILYGINQAKLAIRQDNNVFLVEGNMDVIASHQAGIKNAVAVSGTALTQEQVGIIKRYTQNIKMCFDRDGAGELATKKSIKLCFEKELNVQVVEIPSGKDAAELAKDHPELLQQAVLDAKTAMEYFFKHVFSKLNKEKVEDRKKIAEELLEMIGFLSNDVEKNYWLKKLALEIDMEENMLTDMLKKASLKERVVKNSESSSEKKEEAFLQKDKTEIILQDLIGLMLIYDDVWREVVKRKKTLYFPENELLTILLSRGEEFHFSFDGLLKKMEASLQKKEAERIYFESRYRIGLDDSLEEVVLDSPWKEAEDRLRKMRYEFNKNSLHKISKDWDVAKKNHDQQATDFLKQEYARINEEQQRLNQEMNA